ncbi:hypothetical protein [Sporolactobacillus vineae]|uniref:hypothetical protein n=1 Tax=Sporolactobacillus vineae TaxID=444463 RepID=UPI000288D487|nr:hypothetical protein [Sporolactobacillus vineae]
MDQDAYQYDNDESYRAPNNAANHPVNNAMQGNPAMLPDHRQLKALAEKYQNHYVTGHLKDGRIIEGIILGADHEAVTLLIVEKNALPRDDDSRQFGRFPGFFRFTPFRFPFPFFAPPFFSPFIFPFFWI